MNTTSWASAPTVATNPSLGQVCPEPVVPLPPHQVILAPCEAHRAIVIPEYRIPSGSPATPWPRNPSAGTSLREANPQAAGTSEPLRRAPQACSVDPYGKGLPTPARRPCRRGIVQPEPPSGDQIEADGEDHVPGRGDERRRGDVVRPEALGTPPAASPSPARARSMPPGPCGPGRRPRRPPSCRRRPAP